MALLTSVGVTALVLAGATTLAPVQPDSIEVRLVPEARSTGPAHIMVSGLSSAVVESLREVTWERGRWTQLVEVSVDGQDSDVAPPVVGDYAIVEDSIRFTPLFPFDAGRRYRITLDGSRLPRFPSPSDPSREASWPPIVNVVALPAQLKSPSTVVEKIYPTSDVLPENQLKLYVHFSGPMSVGDGLPFIRLVDEQGDEITDPFLPLGDAFWDPDHRRYTIFFDPGRVKRGIVPNEELGRPILNGKTYTLEILPQWRDAHGEPLKHGFRKTFRATLPDEAPIDTAEWTIVPPAAGSRSSLVVRFHESLDREILRRALRVKTADGKPIAGQAETSDAEAVWSFVPQLPWQRGPHVLEALSFLEDLAGNRIGKPFEVDVFESVPGPDESDSYPIEFEVR